MPSSNLLLELQRTRAQLETERRRHEEQSERALVALKQRDNEIARLRREEIEEARIAAPPQPEPPVAFDERARAVTPKVYEIENDELALQVELARAAAIIAREDGDTNEYQNDLSTKRKIRIRNHQFLVRSEQTVTALEEVKKELIETKNRAAAAATAAKARIHTALRDAAARRDEIEQYRLRLKKNDANAATAVAQAALEAQHWRQEASFSFMPTPKSKGKGTDQAVQAMTPAIIPESRALVVHTPQQNDKRDQFENILREREMKRQLDFANAEIQTLRQELVKVRRDQCHDTQPLSIEEVNDDSSEDEDDQIILLKTESLAEITLREREDELRNYRASLQAMERFVSGNQDKAAMCAHTATLTVRLFEEIGSRGRAERRCARLKQALQTSATRLKKYEKRRGALKAALAAHAAQSEAMSRAAVRHREDLAELRQRIAQSNRREILLNQRFHDATELALNADYNMNNNGATAAAVACATKARLDAMETSQRIQHECTSRELQLRVTLSKSEDIVMKLRQALAIAQDRAASLNIELKASRAAEKTTTLALVEARASIHDQIHRSVDFQNAVIRPLAERDNESSIAALRESRNALARLETRLELVEARADLGGTIPQSIATDTVETQTVPVLIDATTSPLKKSNQIKKEVSSVQTIVTEPSLIEPQKKEEVSALLVLQRLRHVLESTQAAKSERTPELLNEAAALFETLGGSPDKKQAQSILRNGLAKLLESEEESDSTIEALSTDLVTTALSWKRKAAALRLQLLAQKKRSKQLLKSARNEVHELMEVKRQELERVTSQNDALKARLTKLEGIRDDNKRRIKAIAEITERLSVAETERDAAQTERDEAKSQRARALARAAALSHTLKAQQQVKTPATPTSSLSGISATTASTTKDERSRSVDPLQRERLQVLKRRNADAEARAAAADARAAEFRSQRDGARAAVKRRDSALRMAQDQLTKLETHLNLIKESAIVDSQKKSPTASQQERSLRAVLKRLALDFGHGLVRARQRALFAPNDAASMAAASVLDLSPPELADLLAELDDDAPSLVNNKGTNEQESPEVTALLNEVKTAIGPPLDQNRLRNAFHQVVEDRLQLERSLNTTLAQNCCS